MKIILSKKNILVGAVILLLIALSFNLKFIPYFIGIYVLSSLIILIKVKGIFNIKHLLKNPWLILYFAFNCGSLIYTTNYKEGLSNIETQISLLILPFFSLALLFFNERNKNFILQAYIVIVFTSVLFSIIYFISNDYLALSIQNGENFKRILDYINYYNLSFLLHRSYYSLFILFAAIICIELCRSSIGHLRIGKLLILSVFILFMIVISSRAALLCLGFLLFYYCFKLLRKSSISKRLLAFALIVAILIPSIRYTRFNSNLQSIRNHSEIEQIDIRISLWKNAIIAWKENPILGYGIGDSKDKLISIHKNRNIKEASLRKYNCHNQFLETATQTGFVGLIILLLVFAIPFYQSIKKRQELLFLFLIICFINFLFESMLQRLAGVVFFAFWYSFLWFVYYNRDDKENQIETSKDG